MKIRLATLDDIPEMVKLFRMFVESAPLVKEYGEPDPQGMVWCLTQLVRGPSFAVVAEPPEARGVLVGMIAVEVYEMAMFKPLFARDLFVYVHPSYRGLWLAKFLDRAFVEARKVGCHSMFFHAIAAPHEANLRNGEMMVRLGCRELGPLLVRDL